MRKISLIIGLFLLNACQTPKADEKLDPDVVYKRDIELTINGKKTVGMAVAPAKEAYTIGVKAIGKLDLFTFTNCHREMAQQLTTNETTVNFTPIPGLEDKNCSVNLAGYEKERGRHAWGFIEFESPDYTIVATLKCNGVVSVTSGVSVCQSLNGLFQQIEFSVPVIVGTKGQCPPIQEPADFKTYRFPITKGQCSYVFLEKDKNSNRMHRLTTIGYEKIIYRDK